MTAPAASEPEAETPEPAPASRRRSGCLESLLTAVLVMLMCGGLYYGAMWVKDYFGSRDALADKPGVPVPSPTTSPPPDPEFEVSLNGVDGLRGFLEHRVIRTVGMPVPVESACDTQRLITEFTCTVTWGEEVVTYRVEVEPGSGLQEFEATPETVISTRTGIYAALWRKHGGEYGTNLRCDEGIPEIVRVKPKTTLPQRCYVKPTRKHPTFGADEYLTTKVVTITIGDGFIELEAKDPDAEESE